ncbi:hypothetical protein [Halobacteriovorax sp.]|uniref:hypothetical protein n=1 Tax=Halobacteriovorax sp. TaxID=2020862 RepID=UPI00356B60E2
MRKILFVLLLSTLSSNILADVNTIVGKYKGSQKRGLVSKQCFLEITKESDTVTKFDISTAKTVFSNRQKNRVSINAYDSNVNDQMDTYIITVSYSPSVDAWTCVLSSALTGCSSHLEAAYIQIDNDSVPTSFSYIDGKDRDSNSCENLKKIK